MSNLSDEVEDYITGIEEYSNDELDLTEKAIVEEQLRRHELAKMRESAGRKK